MLHLVMHLTHSLFGQSAAPRGADLRELSNEEVLSSLKALVAEGNRILAKVIAYLAEVEDRRIHLELACSSMFEFCVSRLGFSEGEAFRRLTVARLVRRLPAILGALASGRVHLSSIVLLRDHFADSNVEELLKAAAGKSKREVQELVARLAPKPDVASSIRKLPKTAAGPAAPMPASPAPSPAPKAQVLPLSESRYKVQLTATAALRDKLEQARAMMRHRNPSGDLAVIVEQAMDLLLAKLEKERLGKTARPRTAKPSSDPGRVSQATRRKVAERDGGQCTFVSDDGERCEARAFLELDHQHPRALGGTGAPSNVRLLCRAHNRHAAERVFGREHVARSIDLSRNKCGRNAEASKRECRRHMRQNECGRSAEGAKDEDERKSQVRGALRALGFRSAEADRALAAVGQCGWERPVEALVREALGILS